MIIPEEELRHLAYTEEKIREELNKYGIDQADLKQDLFEKRKYLWQELVGADRAIQDQYERTAQESDIYAAEKTLSEAQQQEYRLKKLRETPYFARVDFQEADFPTETYYIGKFGLTDMDCFEQIICDWRSDVAALYYNFEPGPASFVCPNGEVCGEMTLKRQFQIERGEMLGCFDTTLSIQDQFLQRILGAHAGEQMKTIVNSIQKSQDEIIRDTAHSVVVINGCAGSGKTSVALHRIAYLLYHSRSSLSASECMIFSPNTLFEDYIASVLPDLGEDQVWQTTFADFATEVLGDRFAVRTFLDAVSDQCEQHSAEKGSLAFAKRIRTAAEAFEKSIEFHDLTLEGETILTADEQRTAFQQSRKILSYRQSVSRVKNQIIHAIRLRMKELRKKISARLIEENGLSSYLSQKDLMLNARLTGIHLVQNLLHVFDTRYLPDCMAMYAGILADAFNAEEAAAFRSRCEHSQLYFEDAGPLLYLMARLGMLTRSDRIRQIVIDEAQDYTDLQYLLLLELYPHARFTVLGDPEQSLSDTGNFCAVLREPEGRSSAQYTLNVNYRSSKEIVEYTNRLAGKTLCRAVDRSAGPVEEHRLSRSEMASAVSAFLDQGASDELAAVVCADGDDCEWLYREMQRVDTCLLLHEFAARNRRICILPVALAKGLEFDRVAVVDRYGKLTGGRLYVACTRALHHLAVFTPLES